jgi:hypothetical protein
MIPVLLVSIDDVGVATALLAHDAARPITGETLLHRRWLPHHRLTRVGNRKGLHGTNSASRLT